MGVCSTPGGKAGPSARKQRAGDRKQLRQRNVYLEAFIKILVCKKTRENPKLNIHAQSSCTTRQIR